MGSACVYEAKEFKIQPPAGKVMAIVFWDAKVIILDFLPKRRTIPGVNFAKPAENGSP